jgi:hypothetical protein
MDAVATDQDVAGHRDTRTVGEFLESGFGSSFLLREREEGMAGVQCCASEPIDHRTSQHSLQVAAMDRELRHLVTGLYPARFAPDLLSEAVGIDQLARADSNIIESRKEPKFSQLSNGMRQYIDSDSKFSDFWRRLIDVALDSARMQHQAESEPTNTTSDNDDMHRTFPFQAELRRNGMEA